MHNETARAAHTAHSTHAAGLVHASLPACIRAFGAVLALGLLAACANDPTSQRAEPYTEREWQQTQSNRMANLAMRDNLDSLRRIQDSLYKRNPREWRKAAASQAEASSRVWQALERNQSLPELGTVDGNLITVAGIDAIRRAFEPDYAGDRVAALIYGMATMLKEANGGSYEQNFFSPRNAENFYRSARNIEITAWLLTSRLTPEGEPVLYNNEISSQGRNLAVEREMGKIVARLDLLAAHADEKYRRAALDFAHGWLLGNLGPFLSLVPVK